MFINKKGHAEEYFMDNTTIYVLTHKKFDCEKNNLYKPLLNGSALLDEDYGYLRDDNGDNISKLNPYYAEMTGEYWAWKNSNADIIGFCHYRRFFAKNIFLKKLEKEDISSILNEYDIILPQKRRTDKTNLEEAIIGGIEFGTCEKKEDYELLRLILKEECPEYLKCYDEVLNGKEIHYCNMFICKKEIADDYFNWVFPILEKFREQTDFSQYDEGNKRVLGYISERLLNVYVKKHNLKVKDKYLYIPDAIHPLFPIIENRFTIVQKFVRVILKTQKKFKKIK